MYAMKAITSSLFQGMMFPIMEKWSPLTNLNTMNLMQKVPQTTSFPSSKTTCLSL